MTTGPGNLNWQPALDHPDLLAAPVVEALRGLGAQGDVRALVAPIDPDLADTAEFCRAYGVSLAESANTIVVASRQPPGHNAACVALATTRLDVNGLIRRRLGVRKVSFASAETTRDLTGMEIGGVTIPGLPGGLPVWVDSAVTAVPSVVIGAGTRTAKIRLGGADLAGLAAVEVVDGLALAA